MELTLDKNIRNVIFDFGGVLVDWNPRHLFKDYFKTEEEMEYFLKNICTDEWNSRQDAGRSLAEGTALLQKQFPEFAEPIGMYYGQWDKMIGGEISGNVELLKKLKSQGYKLYGLTNWSCETLPRVRNRYDFFKLFDGIVVSGEEHIVKPDPRIYQILLDRYKLVPEECVFLDDSARNVEAARKLGISAIQVVR